MTNAKPDGCTASPELWYHACCNRHDLDYMTGRDERGQVISRFEADRRFFRCMRQAGKSLPVRGLVLPAVYFLAVRVAGWWWWNRSRKQDTSNDG